MSTAALFTRAKIWKQPKHPSTDKWIKNSWYIYTMEYYLAIKNAIVPLVPTWMELEGIVLSEIYRAKKRAINK